MPFAGCLRMLYSPCLLHVFSLPGRSDIMPGAEEASLGTRSLKSITISSCALLQSVFDKLISVKHNERRNKKITVNTHGQKHTKGGKRGHPLDLHLGSCTQEDFYVRKLVTNGETDFL